MIGTLVTTIALMAVSAGDFADRFKVCEYHYTGGSYHNELFRYRLLVPPSPKPGQRYPFLVWLHGAGEGGKDNRSQLRYFNMMIDSSNLVAGQQLFLLAVQCPIRNSPWFRQSCDANVAPGDESITVAVEILRNVMREHPVDQDRVYVAGVSSGGSGCWEIALRYPELFAAIAPMSSAGGDTSRAARLKNIPIWAFHNLDDDQTPPDGDKAMVAAVNGADGDAYLTFPPSPGWKHDSWTAAIKKSDILPWMLAQRRGSLCWQPPGCDSWKWQNILAMPAGMLAIVWLAWRREKRRRQRRNMAAIADQEQSRTSTQGMDEQPDFTVRLPDEIESTAKEGHNG